MKLELTNKVPTKEGYYWFYDGELEIVKVEMEEGVFYAQNEVLCFKIYKEENEFWCYIPEPTLNGKKL